MQAIMKYFADDPNFDDFGNDDNSCYLSITLKFQNFEKISGDSSVLFFLLDTKSFIFILYTYILIWMQCFFFIGCRISWNYYKTYLK